MAQLDTVGIFVQSQVARSMASLKGAAETALQLTVVSAIATAISNGLFSATASVAAQTAQNIQSLIGMLTALGYGATVSGTTLTVTW